VISYLDIKTDILFDVKSIIESIIEYATRNNIDLIVIGTRGRTGLKRFFMGSVARWNIGATLGHIPGHENDVPPRKTFDNREKINTHHTRSHKEIPFKNIRENKGP